MDKCDTEHFRLPGIWHLDLMDCFKERKMERMCWMPYVRPIQSNVVDSTDGHCEGRGSSVVFYVLTLRHCVLRTGMSRNGQ